VRWRLLIGRCRTPLVTAYAILSLIEPVNPLWCLLYLLDGVRSQGGGGTRCTPLQSGLLPEKPGDIRHIFFTVPPLHEAGLNLLHKGRHREGHA